MSESSRAEVRSTDSPSAWRWFAWFSALLVLVGLSDLVLAWVPLRVGVPEWEFATVAQTMAGLPLSTIGLAGLLGSAIVLGRRRLVLGVSMLLVVLATFVFGALVLFLLDVPLALRASQGPASVGVQKAILKTLLLGIAFGAAYAIAGIAGIRAAKRL